jgi:hypothetical protein
LEARRGAVSLGMQGSVRFQVDIRRPPPPMSEAATCEQYP